MFDENKRARVLYEAKGFVKGTKSKISLGAVEVMYEKVL